MKDLRFKKAIAASLSLTLALGSVPAVALADDADENSEGATSEQSTQAELSFSANGGQFTDGQHWSNHQGKRGRKHQCSYAYSCGLYFQGLVLSVRHGWHS